MTESRYTKFKRSAFVGGSVGVCVGLAVGATSMIGRTSAPPTVSHYMVSSVLSVAAWMSCLGLRGFIGRERFPALLVQSGAAHANTPLEHLRLLNNAPPSFNPYRPSRTFVHTR
ncbi:hypothetical protein BCR43DRAFT_482485 [Syncephalastrum racemosum]|uniref:Reactive mitochondrial oxygen species modulator 1-domain-containing protein n=1 Tax=Syncephalastrum racemosum TaxID=13706 RepID=A0A1X2HV52_SYNRA|nr:hypothetical protein BCR43DRAFT_482485 [Syncephalastrum racemosum]